VRVNGIAPVMGVQVLIGMASVVIAPAIAAITWAWSAGRDSRDARAATRPSITPAI
jgi:hypothetical protein